MAERTRESLMPRLRNWRSIISARSTANSSPEPSRDASGPLLRNGFILILPFPHPRESQEQRSHASGKGKCRRMLFPSACFENLRDLRNREVAFIFSIVEVWRKLNTGFRAVVDQNLPRQQFTTHFGCMRTIDGNRPR